MKPAPFLKEAQTCGAPKKRRASRLLAVAPQGKQTRLQGYSFLMAVVAGLAVLLPYLYIMTAFGFVPLGVGV